MKIIKKIGQGITRVENNKQSIKELNLLDTE